jgi:hypothetical protein
LFAELETLLRNNETEKNTEELDKIMVLLKKEKEDLIKVVAIGEILISVFNI